MKTPAIFSKAWLKVSPTVLERPIRAYVRGGGGAESGSSSRLLQQQQLDQTGAVKKPGRENLVLVPHIGVSCVGRQCKWKHQGSEQGET